MAKAKKDEIIARLRIALDAKGLSDKQASQNAGFGDTFVHDVLSGTGGKFENLEHLCRANGILWEWLKNGSGTMLPSSGDAMPDPSRQIVLTIAEAILAHCFPRATVARLRAVSQALLAIAENPPNDMSGIDKTSRIRNGILGALRLFVHQLDQEDS